MSRGGRGGGDNPWANDPNFQGVDGRPSELFPPYNVPVAAPLTKKEEKQVSYFLLFREQVHDGPLYTHTRTFTADTTEPTRVYGQEQINKRYGLKNKATVDPFLAMPTYSQRFIKQERALPDLADRPFAKEFFPPELHATLDGEDTPAAGGAKRRRLNGKKTLALSNITSLRTAADIFMPDQDQAKALELLDKLGDDDNPDELLLDDDDDWVRTNEDGEEAVDDPEDEFDDESDNDYNAEQYFEGGDADEDYDDGGDGGGEEYI
ncbi:DNA-directed RNA polymerase III, subunit Rpc31 [Coniochaeta sp. 2T2.1]|nr:DNA-directed RNA polymerase III, subunit Rpc31 [Coniochaeta sp. 2T2.1]